MTTNKPLLPSGNAIPSRLMNNPIKPSEIIDGMFIPEGLSKSTPFQRRIAIVGGPGTGKTESCLTFPNRTWLNFDNKLPTGEDEIKFWDTGFCNSIVKPDFSFPNRRDAFKQWLFKNLFKFTEKQTVIMDSWTMMMNAFEKQTQAEYDQRVLNNPESENGWWIPKERKKFGREICECLKEAKCLVVVIFHETEKWLQGKPSGKLGPVMDGSFADEIFGFFTDVWHQKSHIAERDAKGNVMRIDNKAVIKKVNHNGNPNWVWFWQLAGDDTIDLNCNKDLSARVQKYNLGMVPADYAEIQKIYKME